MADERLKGTDRYYISEILAYPKGHANEEIPPVAYRGYDIELPSEGYDMMVEETNGRLFAFS